MRMRGRLVLHGFALLVVVACVARAYAQDLDQDVVEAADEAGVDAMDLQGAVNSTGLGPREYLYAVGELAPPNHAMPQAVITGWPARVRLTHYVEYGVTYGGGHPFPGSTACSWNFALGSRFRLPDGEVFVCNDRGLLGSSGWLDLWRRPDLARLYGPYVTVTVLP